MVQARFEVCVETMEALEMCRVARVDTVELCAALALGGLSPGAGMLAAARALVDVGIAVHAMVRPRAGVFVWSAPEIALMTDEIAAIRRAGLTGAVVGAGSTSLDVGVLAALAEAGQGLDLTLHRVVDLLPDPLAAVDVAVELGFRRILTSGGARTASAGAPTLGRMVRAAQGRVEIVAASGLTADAVAHLAEHYGVRSFHASCQVPHAPETRLVELGFAVPTERRIDAGTLAVLHSAVRAIR
jgi:copper homeostasis protein